ncbi:PRC-barrel domain-containing protein [Umezawaea sp. Da 62-37]|uniref:PRC-barrel domain-containing protein n=1 Tax=Umezawaea sp. Da 62-37 TaxID=3075927 RepID=UPI0028F71AD7|nr:PRC-barrel domain-containing protein [Umezawaea sp. Da 62-37]WNV83019.1 PRC-barrel domain-containing protein [Umezawaea sp. Da 62-37]
MLASDFLGRTAYDADGIELGRVADLIAGPDGRVRAVLVAPPRRGRMLGYERPSVRLPWAFEWLARLLHRGTREVEWSTVRWE